jgi:hypothetical protein
MRDGDLLLRRFEPADDNALQALFAEPEVKRWWPDGYYDRDNGWVVEVAAALAGWVEDVEESYEWYPSVALDIALTASLHGAGYGRRVLRLVIDHFVAKAIIASRSTRTPKTSAPSTPSRRPASNPSGCCAPASAIPTAGGTTNYSWT